MHAVGGKAVGAAGNHFLTLTPKPNPSPNPNANPNPNPNPNPNSNPNSNPRQLLPPARTE